MYAFVTYRSEALRTVLRALHAPVLEDPRSGRTFVFTPVFVEIVRTVAQSLALRAFIRALIAV